MSDPTRPDRDDAPPDDDAVLPDEESLSLLELDEEEEELDPAADNLADQDEENMYGNL